MQVVPVRGNAFWPSHSSQGIHYLSPINEEDLLEVGHLSTHVPRPLAHQLSRGSVLQFYLKLKFLSLTNCLGHQDKEDRSLCPVRALIYYLSRTSDLRHGRSLLFVSLLKFEQGDIAAQKISNWIKDLIHFTFKNCSTNNASLHGVKAHDVRAQAAPRSFRSAVPLLDIMRSYTWKNHSTFTSFYFRDVSLKILEDSYRLGDIVAAQRVVSLST